MPYSPVGVDEKDNLPPQVRERVFGSIVDDSVGEWWIWPLATYDADRNRTIGGGLSGDRGDGLADVIVWERNHGTGKVFRYVIGSAPVDDHNVPSVLLLPDGSVFVSWNYHNVDTNQRAKLSNRSGDLRSLVSAKEIVWNLSFDIAYSQAHLITSLSTDTSFVVWDFVRMVRGDGWAWEIIPITINTVTRDVSRGSTKRFISGGPTNQTYCMTAQADVDGVQHIRAFAGFNPAAAVHHLHYFDINCETGAVTSVGNPALSANVNTQSGVPITLMTETPAVADVAAGKSRRLFYPRSGPANHGFLYAEWDTDNPHLGHYWLRAQNDPDSANGLKANQGMAACPNNDTLFNDLVNGFEYTWVGKFDALPAGTREVGRRYVGTGDRQWFLRVTSAGKLIGHVTRAPDAGLDITSAASIPSYSTALLSKIGIRMKVERISGTNNVSFFISTNTTDGIDGTWTLLEAAQTAGSALLFDTSAPLVVGGGAASLQQGIITYAHVLRNSSGSIVSAVNWTNKTQRASTVADGQGNVFAVSGDASVWSTTPTWVNTDLGLTGPRVGYTALANYIGGAGFRTPCQPDDPILVTRRNFEDTGSTLEEVYIVNGVVESEVIESASNGTKGTQYIMRPSRPVNGGPLRSVHTVIDHYTDVFTEYRGRIKSA